MSIKIHLPDNSEFEIKQNCDVSSRAPEVDQRFYICYNFTLNFKCNLCRKCNHNIVVEMSEDRSEIWVEFE